MNMETSSAGDSIESSCQESSSQDENFLEERLAEITKRAAEFVPYRHKCEQAKAFADGHTGDAWDSLFLMGLAIAGLELVPWSTDITPEPFWATAPEPKGELSPWDISWIVPSDYFNKVQT